MKCSVNTENMNIEHEMPLVETHLVTEMRSWAQTGIADGFD